MIDIMIKPSNISIEDAANKIAKELYPFVDECVDMELLEVIIIESLEDLNDSDD